MCHVFLQSRRSKLAPQQTLDEEETAQTSTASADPALPVPAVAPTAPSLETPSKASSQPTSHTTPAPPDDMQRAASHGSVSSSKLDAVHMQSLISGGQADGSPAGGASISLDSQHAAEPSTSGIATILEYQVTMLFDRHQAFEAPAVSEPSRSQGNVIVTCICTHNVQSSKNSCTRMERAELCLGLSAGNPSSSSPQHAETSARSPLPPVRSVSPLQEDELHERGEIRDSATQPLCRPSFIHNGFIQSVQQEMQQRSCMSVLSLLLDC